MSTTEKLAALLADLRRFQRELGATSYAALVARTIETIEAQAVNPNQVIRELERGRQPLTSSQLVELATAVDMPPERVTLCVQSKMDRFARAIEAAHGIGKGGAA